MGIVRVEEVIKEVKLRIKRGIENDQLVNDMLEYLEEGIKNYDAENVEDAFYLVEEYVMTLKEFYSTQELEVEDLGNLIDVIHQVLFLLFGGLYNKPMFKFLTRLKKSMPLLVTVTQTSNKFSVEAFLDEYLNIMEEASESDNMEDFPADFLQDLDARFSINWEEAITRLVFNK